MKHQQAKTYAKRARRRKTGRTNTAALKRLSETAYRIGGPAKRLYATIRLSITRNAYRDLKAIAKYCNVTLSKAARALLSIGADLSEGRTAEACKKASRLIKTSNRSKHRLRKTKSKIDLWAAAEGKATACNLVNLKLTAQELADIETERQERKAKRAPKGKSYSRAFCTMLSLPAIPFKRAIRASDSGGLHGEANQSLKPTKAKQDRTPEEAKRPALDRQTSNGL